MMFSLTGMIISLPQLISRLTRGQTFTAISTSNSVSGQHLTDGNITIYIKTFIVCILHFTLCLNFTPCLQSTVRNPHSAVLVVHMTVHELVFFCFFFAVSFAGASYSLWVLLAWIGAPFLIYRQVIVHGLLVFNSFRYLARLHDRENSRKGSRFCYHGFTGPKHSGAFEKLAPGSKLPAAMCSLSSPFLFKTECLHMTSRQPHWCPKL